MRKINIYDLSTNDVELTELRKQMIKDEGFPVWLVTVTNAFTNEVESKEIFVTNKARDEYINSLKSISSIEIELIKIKDVTFLSYKTKEGDE